MERKVASHVSDGLSDLGIEAHGTYALKAQLVVVEVALGSRQDAVQQDKLCLPLNATIWVRSVRLLSERGRSRKCCTHVICCRALWICFGAT